MAVESRWLSVAIQRDVGDAVRQALTADVDLQLTHALLGEDVAPPQSDTGQHRGMTINGNSQRPKGSRAGTSRDTGESMHRGGSRPGTI